MLLAQFVAITIWFLISIIQWANNPKSNPGILVPIMVRGVEGLSIWISSGVLIVVLEILLKRTRQAIAIGLVFLMIYPVALIANLLSIGIRSLIGYAAPPLGAFFYVHSLHFFIPLLLILVFIFILRFRSSLQDERVKALQAESLSREANWMMLRYQVNPHFLFNALNSVRALIGQNNERARDSITEISEYFRYSLSVDGKSLVSIKDEVEAVRSYMKIQQMRYGSRLVYHFSISENVSGCLVPAFTLQTLVENAVKYGMKSTDEQVDVEVAVSKSRNQIKIDVFNTGQLFSENKEDGTGTGLMNLRRRFEMMDENSELKLSRQNGKVRASISFRIITGEE